MRVSYNWLLELLPDLRQPPDEVGRRLTSLGLELDAQHEFGVASSQVLISEVVSIEPHPERDKLRLVTVDTGKGAPQRVVCGAQNVPSPGGLVVLAPLGTTLPAIGLTLTPRNLGGIVSEGMLCSESELGLAAESKGILTFEPGLFPKGTPLSQALPASRDTIFELGITPNRPDALGHIGVARDLAASYGLSFSPPVPAKPQKTDATPLAKFVQLHNHAPTRCPRYGAALVRDVRVSASPVWMRWRLFALGVRPVSNVVDVTNWVLLEYGNPMHAFDLSRVGGQQINVRMATPGELLTTLDGQRHELTKDDLVIADAREPSALAGVMGGKESEINADTRDVLLEAAYFDPAGIRRTAKRVGLHSDSSYRFERGVDWAALDRVLLRAQGLLCELASGTAVVERQVSSGVELPLPEIRLRKARLNRLLGTSLELPRALQILTRLGFETLESGAEEAKLRGASFRPDVKLEADLIEEVARIEGLDAIAEKLPRILPQVPSNAGKLESQVRQWARARGLSEAVCYSFVSPKELRALHAPEPSVVLQNPLSLERSVLTTSLLAGLTEALGRARRHGEHDVRLFTVGSRFLGRLAALPSGKTQSVRPRAEADLAGLVEERLSFACVLAGHRHAHLKKAEPLDVYDAKGLAVQLVKELTSANVEVRWAGAGGTKLPHLHPRGAAELWVGSTFVGCFGPLHPDVSDELSLGANVFCVEIDLAALEQLPDKPVARFEPLPRLPAITRDLAVETDSSLSARDLLEEIQRSAGGLCESVELFDLFVPDPNQPLRRSLAFRIVYRDPKAKSDPDNAKTLTDKEVDARQEHVVEAVRRLGAVPRA